MGFTDPATVVTVAYYDCLITYSGVGCTGVAGEGRAWMSRSERVRPAVIEPDRWREASASNPSG
jgi:hypothetical protein